jgi:hypothetical protein
MEYLNDIVSFEVAKTAKKNGLMNVLVMPFGEILKIIII